jgi:hypothetical protein
MKTEAKTQIVIIDRTESLVQSISSDVVTFGFLFLCMWYSYSSGGGWWTFFTCCMFLLSLAVKLPGTASTQVVKIGSKKEAVEWAQSLPDDEQP